MDKTQKYIRLNNEIQALREDKKLGKNKTQKSKRQGYEGDKKNYPVSHGRDDQDKFRNYTPLNDSRTHILIYMRKNDNEIKWLTKLKPDKASKQGKTKYY